jgi:hypothetical protein
MGYEVDFEDQDLGIVYSKEKKKLLGEIGTYSSQQDKRRSAAHQGFLG